LVTRCNVTRPLRRFCLVARGIAAKSLAWAGSRGGAGRPERRIRSQLTCKRCLVLPVRRKREVQGPRSYTSKRLQGPTVSLLPGQLTLPCPHLSPVLATAGSINRSAQTSTQKYLYHRSLPFIDPVSACLDSFGTTDAPDGACQRLGSRLSQQTVARTQKRETRTRLLGHSLTPPCGRRRPFDRHDSRSNTFHHLRECDRNTHHVLERIRSKFVPQGLHVSR